MVHRGNYYLNSSFVATPISRGRVPSFYAMPETEALPQHGGGIVWGNSLYLRCTIPRARAKEEGGVWGDVAENPTRHFLRWIKSSPGFANPTMVAKREAAAGGSFWYGGNPNVGQSLPHAVVVRRRSSSVRPARCVLSGTPRK